MLQSNINLINPYHMRTSTFSESVKQLSVMLLAAVFMSLDMYASTLSRVETFNPAEFSITTSEVEGMSYSVLKFGDLPATGEPGYPMLLRRYVSLALPLGATNVELKNISYEVADDIHVNNPVFPGQEYGPMNGLQPEFVMPNATEYARMDYMPGDLVSIVDVECFEGINNVVTLAVSPVMYSPGKGIVRVLNKISYSINYEQLQKSKMQNEGTFVRNEDIGILKSLVVNPADVNDVSHGRIRKVVANDAVKITGTIDRKIVGDGIPVYEYCIVTSKELAPAFERLVALKRLHGLDAGIVCIEDILSDSHFSQGDRISNIKDDAGCLRQYLKEAWSVTRYALLGGKPPIVPIRYAVDRDYAGKSALHKKSGWVDFYIPTDHYFSEFRNNWNYDGDDLYGEPIGKFGYDINHIYVGRLLCTTIEDVNNYIDKLEFYEMNPGCGDISYLSNSYLYFSNESKRDWFVNEKGQSLAEHKIVPDAVKKIHPNQDIVYEGSEKTRGAKIINDIKGGKYGFWDLHGHGNPGGVNLGNNGWPSYGVNALDSERRYLQPESGNGLDNMDNFGSPGYSYSMSCTTMAFDSPRYKGYGEFDGNYDDLSKNFGESYTLGKNYGGVAFLGNTRVGIFGYSAYMESRFFSFMDIPSMANREIGACERWSKTTTGSPRLSENKDYSHLVRMTHNILGDPSLRIWRGDFLDANREYDVHRIRNGFIISDMDDSMNYPYAKVAVREPNGNIVIENMISGVRIDSVSPCSSLAVFGDDIVCRPLDFKLQNIVIDQSDYIYCSDAELGSHIMAYNDCGKVEFCKGVKYTIDATADVALRKGSIVKSGATLKIITPKNCALDGIEIEEGGNLIVYAGSVTADRLSQTFPEGSICNFYKYNKYGVLEDGTLDIQWVRNVKSKAAGNDYHPMLEMGKTWEYNVVDYVIPERAKPNIWRVLKLDGTTEIDGKEYYVMHCYLNGSEKPYCGVPVGYFREDLNTRQVFFIKDEEYNEDYIFDHPFQDKFDWPEGETELYYFGFPGRFLGDEKSSNERAIDFIANDGAHKGYDYGSWVMAEGLGLIPIEAHCHGDLFGIPVMFSGFQPYMSYLCHIKDGEGNVLLSYDENVTLCGTYCWDSLDSITDDAHEVKVRIAGENIEISGSCALGNILLMNVQGMIVYREYVWDNKVSIPVGSMLRGVYLVKVGDRVYKVTV